MPKHFARLEDYYLINVVAERERIKPLVNAAVELGVRPTIIVNGRGILHRKKVGFIPLPGISPAMDVLYLLVPKSDLDSVMNALIQVGKLDHFGAGALYVSALPHLWFCGPPPYSGAKRNGQPKPHPQLQEDLILINCICQRGHAEEIARGAMSAGSPSPTISFGYGHGIRDKLNFFLQLAINPSKEMLQVIVGSAEADRYFEVMVSSGHLDHPGMGFISTHPVQKGLVNTLSYQSTSPYPATMEQIIKAIDQLSGNTHWRSSGSVQTAPVKKRKLLLHLASIHCIVKRGLGDVCSLAAMEAGAGGTSVTYANAFPVEQQGPRALAGSDEREIISMTIGENQVDTIVKAVTSVKELAESHALIYAYPTIQALTYLKAG